MKRLDIILIVFYILAATAVGIWALEPDAGLQKQVIIEHENEPYATYRLPVDEEVLVEIEENGHYNLIRISEDGVEMIEANCPDQLCVHDGAKSKVGEILVCLPNQVLIEIEGNQEEDVDFISH